MLYNMFGLNYQQLERTQYPIHTCILHICSIGHWRK